MDGLILPDLPMYEFEKEYGARDQTAWTGLCLPGDTGNVRGADSQIRFTEHRIPLCRFFVVHDGKVIKNLADQQAYFERLERMKLQQSSAGGIRD